MPDFKGNKKITLREGDADIPFDFKFTQSSSVSANDGWLPDETDVNSLTVSGFKDDTAGTNVTIELIEGIPTIVNNIAGVNLNYPGSEGRFHLKFICILSNGSTRIAWYKRINAEI